MEKGNLEYKIEYNNEIVIKNFELYAGDSLNFIISLKENINDAHFVIIDKNNEIVIAKNYGDGIIDLGDNNYAISVTSNDTNTLTKANYYYKLVIVYNEKTITVMAGIMDILLTSTNVHGFIPSALSEMIDLSSFANKTIVYLDFDVTSIRRGAFTNCVNLALTSLPDGIEFIGSSAFAGCANLALTSLPSKLTSIEQGAFSNCTNLALRSLPNGLNYINPDAFTNCVNLAITSLPSGIHSINTNAFKNCTGLTTLTFNGTPETIDSTAFVGCTNLTNIYVPWAFGAVANAPWGATNATIHYNS